MTYELPKIGDVVYLKGFSQPIEIRVDEILITECETYIINYWCGEKHSFVLGREVFTEI